MMTRIVAILLIGIFAISVYADDTPRGIYRAHEVPASPLLLASGLAWSNAGLVIADRKEKRLVVLRPDGKFETGSVEMPCGRVVTCMQNSASCDDLVKNRDGSRPAGFRL